MRCSACSRAFDWGPSRAGFIAGIERSAPQGIQIDVAPGVSNTGAATDDEPTSTLRVLAWLKVWF